MRKILELVDGSISSQFAATLVADRMRAGEALALHLLNVQYRQNVHAGLAKVVSASMRLASRARRRSYLVIPAA